MGQKRITDQKTCGLFVLNVMRVMVQIITEICCLQSKKYSSLSPAPTTFLREILSPFGRQYD